MPEEPKNGVDITDLTDSLDAQNQQAQEAAQRASDSSKIVLSNVRLRQAVTDGLESLANVLTAHEPHVVVKNQPKVAVSVKVPEITEVVTKLQDLINLESAEETYKPVVDALDKLQAALTSQEKGEEPDYTEQFANLEAAIKAIEVQPQVNLKPNIKVQNDLTELTNVTDAVNKVEKAVGKIKIPSAPKVDTQSIKDAVDKVYEAIANLSFPVPNYVLPFKDSTGKAVQVQLDALGNLPIAGGGGGGGTQYAETTTTSPGYGNLTLGRYLSTPPSLTTGQMNALQLDSAGNLKVTGSLSVGGTTDNSAYTAGTSTGTPAMGFYHSTVDTVTDGRAAALAIDNKRNLMVNISNASVAVTGTFWQATQPISAASLPLPTGAATEATLGNVAKDATLTGGTQKSIVRGGAKGTTSAADVTSTAVDANTQALDVSLKNASLAVTGTFWQTTQPVSLAVNTPDVTDRAARLLGHVTVDNSSIPVTGTFWQATQPVSLATNTPDVTDRAARLLGHVTVDNASLAVTGSITANAGTNLNTSALALDATLTGGTAKAINRGGAKGTTAAADITSTASGANHQLMDVAMYDASGNQITSFGGGTQYADGTAAATPTGTQTNWNEAGTQRATSLTKPLPIQAGTGVTIPVSLATAPTTPVTGTFWQATQPVSLATNTPTLQASSNIIGKVGIDQTTPGTTNGVQINAALPAGTNVIGALTANQSINNSQIGGVAVATGNGVTGTGSQRVTIASDNASNTNPWLVAQQTAATSTLASVTGAITSTTLLAANTARKGAYFYNDSTAILYLAFAATASTTAYTLQIPAGGYYEMPEKPLYTGLITGIWAAANGAVRVTELT